MNNIFIPNTDKIRYTDVSLKSLLSYCQAKIEKKLDQLSLEYFDSVFNNYVNGSVKDIFNIDLLKDFANTDLVKKSSLKDSFNKSDHEDALNHLLTRPDYIIDIYKYYSSIIFEAAIKSLKFLDDKERKGLARVCLEFVSKRNPSDSDINKYLRDIAAYCKIVTL